jgi:dTDP-glucose pyrophosphorylase
MNLVIPIASDSDFFNLAEYCYPKPLIEVCGKPIIQLVIENLVNSLNYKKIIFIVKQSDCDKYHLDNTLNLLSPIQPIIIKLRSDTQGALCSVLLAIDYIDSSESLMISNADQIFDGGIERELKTFMESDLDAACLTFESVHPRWSYVRVNEQKRVLETAEKNPISKNAIAGVYLYKKGSEFLEYAMNTIKNGVSVNEKYFIAPVFNEYLLHQKKVGLIEILNSRYHTFYSPKKIEEYESFIGSKRK